MKRSIVAAVCAFVFAGAVGAHAQAQVLPGAIPIDAGPARLPAPPSSGNAAAPAGITVTGRAAVRVKADGLRFNAMLGSRTNPPGADTGAAAAAIAAALKKSGVADAAVAVAPNGSIGTYTPTVINGSLRNPSRERVRALFGDALAAAAAYPNVVLQNLALALSVDDCSAAETRAAGAAVADARARAERYARAAGVALGRVTAINVGGLPSSACALHPDDVSVPGFTPIDPNGSADVSLVTSVTVTFALR